MTTGAANFFFDFDNELSEKLLKEYKESCNRKLVPSLKAVNRSTLYRLIDSGQLRTVKIGRRTLVRSSSLVALIDDSELRGSVVA
jgi:excisionase family DNA binding protein